MDQHPRFRAIYRGGLLGEYDTLLEAEDVVAEIRATEQAEEDEFTAWLNQPVE